MEGKVKQQSSLASYLHGCVPVPEFHDDSRDAKLVLRRRRQASSLPFNLSDCTRSICTRSGPYGVFPDLPLHPHGGLMFPVTDRQVHPVEHERSCFAWGRAVWEGDYDLPACICRDLVDQLALACLIIAESGARARQ